MVGGALFWPFLVPCGCYSSFLGLFDFLWHFPRLLHVRYIFTVYLQWFCICFLPSLSIFFLQVIQVSHLSGLSLCSTLPFQPHFYSLLQFMLFARRSVLQCHPHSRVLQVGGIRHPTSLSSFSFRLEI